MDCDHLWIEDEHIVCKLCGLVNDDLYYGENEMRQTTSNYYYNTHNYEMTAKEVNMCNRLMDIIHYFNLPVFICFDIIQKVQKDPRKNLSDSLKLAIHLYDKCNEMGNFIRLHDIALICDVPPKKIYQNSTEKSYFQGEDILNKMGRMLNLTNEEQKIVRKKMEGKKITGHSPYTEAAAYIYYYLKNKLSMRDVSLAANVNPISIKRYIFKHIDNEKEKKAI